MKKLLLLLTLLALFVLCITACGDTNVITTTPNEEDTTVTTTQDTTTTPVTTEAPTIEGNLYAFLGSSVTYGSASGGYSFADALRDTYHCRIIKQAISGTTLVDNGPDSYVQRVKKIHKSMKIQHLIVQLSTNDASQKKPLGELTADDVKDITAFDTTTVIGAIEYIICYAQETWGCPVSFYTGTRYSSVEYTRMVQALLKIQKKWGIGVIDLWNDAEMRKVSDEDYARYMSDPIHPTKEGYIEWWMPKFHEHLLKYE